MNSVITGTGSYIPTITKTNADFNQERFFNDKNEPFEATNSIIIEKFKAITGIEERRYAADDKQSSDIALIAAQKAIEDANIDPEELDYIILAQNSV